MGGPQQGTLGACGVSSRLTFQVLQQSRDPGAPEGLGCWVDAQAQDQQQAQGPRPVALPQVRLGSHNLWGGGAEDRERRGCVLRGLAQSKMEKGSQSPLAGGIQREGGREGPAHPKFPPPDEGREWPKISHESMKVGVEFLATPPPPAEGKGTPSRVRSISYQTTPLAPPSGGLLPTSTNSLPLTSSRDIKA